MCRVLSAVLFMAVAAPAHMAQPDVAGVGTYRKDKLHPNLRNKVDASGQQEMHTVVIKVRERARLEAVEFRSDDAVAALKFAAQQGQSRVVTYLRARGATVLNQFWLTNAILARVDRATLEGLTNLHEVDIVFDNFRVSSPPTTQGAAPADEAGLTWGVEKVQADRVWSELGFTGEGIRVAVLDTGVDISHPDLAGRMHSDNPGDPTFPGGWMEFDANGNRVASEPRDTHGHGTHVSGTVLGGGAGGVQIGVAPGAALMHGMVIPFGGGTFAQVVAGMQWAVDPTDADGNPAGERAHIASMSFGADGLYAEMIEPIRNMYFAGVVPVAAIGNCGAQCVGSPGAVFEAWGIGATDIDDGVADFSSGGVVSKSGWSNPPDEWPDEWIKPDISAPGVDVLSAVPGGGYESWSGTSMATPHVSGVAALMLSANPALSPDDLLDALVETSFFDPRYGEERPNIRYGWGRIDAYEAVSLVGYTGGITGTVTDRETGAPLDQAVVAVSPGERSVRTRADGTFTLPLPPGTYLVEILRFGYEPASVADVVVTEGSHTPVSAALTPLPTGTVTGRITYDRTGSGIPGATVRVKHVPIRIEAVTDTDGAYQIRLPAGTYDLEVSAYGFAPAEASGVTVTAGETTAHDASLSALPRVGIIGDVDGILSRFLSGEGYLAEEVWFDVRDRLGDYQSLIVNYPGPAGPEEFTGLVEAAHEAGVGMVFTQGWGDGWGIGLLSRHYGDPVSTYYDFGPNLTAELTGEHDALLPGLRAGDRFPVISGFYDIAWIEGYSGEPLATLHDEVMGERGPGFAWKQHVQNRHVLLASLGAIWWQGPAQWSEEARSLFTNAVDWTARPDGPGARFVLHDLSVTPDTVLWYEPVTVTLNVKNIGDQTGTLDLVLLVNGQPEALQPVTIGPDGSEQITFTVHREKVGSYKIQAGHLSASFRVRPPRVTVQASTIELPPSGRGRNRDPGEPAIPLAGAQVDLVQGARVISRGTLDMEGNLTFDSTGSRESYTLVVRHTGFGYNVRRNYLLTMAVSVEDDTSFTFRPAAGDTARLSVTMAARSPSHHGTVFVANQMTGRAGFEFPTGELVATPGSYQAAYVMAYDVPGAQWTYASDWVERQLTPGTQSFAFGGALSLSMQDVVGQQAPSPELTWGVTDEYGHQINSVFKVPAGAFGLSHGRVVEDITTWPGVVAAAAQQAQNPVLTLTNPAGSIERTGTVAWTERPKEITVQTEQVMTGDYRLDMQFDSGPYVGVLTAGARMMLPARTVSRTVLRPGDTFDVTVVFDAGAEGELTLTETLPEGFTITRQSSSPRGQFSGSTWTWQPKGKGSYRPGQTVQVNYTVKVGADVPTGTYRLAGAVMQSGTDRIVAGPAAVQVFR